MTRQRKIALIVLLVGVGLGLSYYTGQLYGPKAIPDKEVEIQTEEDKEIEAEYEKAQESYDQHHAIENLEKLGEETVIKTFSHGNTTFTYEVGIENGVEESPPQSIIDKIKAAYTKEELAIQYASYKESDYWKKRMQILGERGSQGVLAKKADIDNNFTCDNYKYYAEKYVTEALPGFTINGKYVGTFEAYVYWKAFHECLDPKYNEKMEKVYHELDEVNATSLEDVNVYD